MPQLDMSSIKAEDLFLDTVYDSCTYRTVSLHRMWKPTVIFDIFLLCQNTFLFLCVVSTVIPKNFLFLSCTEGLEQVKCELEIAHLLLGKWDLTC